MKQLSRRDFVRVSMAGFGTAILSTGLTSCLSNDDTIVPVSFDYGVASGDPLADRVIIWTHITAEDDQEVEVSWEVIEDASNVMVVSGSAKVNSSTGHTLKVDVAGLMANQRYRYLFKSNGVTSSTGFTKTIPEGDDVDLARFAVVSCANYPAGYFHVYSEVAAQTNIDAVLHLGDYLYEYGATGYATERAEELGRQLPEDNSLELLTLSDYRKRYALYRGDTDLQNCHATHPFIAVWDDHEVTNDSYKNGAQNHNEGEGDYQERKMQALQAYFEWMPIRVNPLGDGFRSYRQFKFGNLLDLYMLDTRLEGRDVQLAVNDFVVNDVLDAASFTDALSDDSRTMLGQEQLLWLQTELTTSTSTWQVLGQQVLMGRMLLPTAISTQALSIADFATIANAAQISGRVQSGDPSLTQAERDFLSTNQALLTTENIALIQQPAIPYNLDAWDGYGYEREILLNTAKAAGSNLVVLAGDTHNAWANNLKTISGEAVGIELATSSVSSPGLENYLQISGRDEAIATEAGLLQIVTDLKYNNALERGYMLVEFTPSKVVSEWRFVDTVLDTNYSVADTRGKVIEVLTDADGIQIS